LDAGRILFFANTNDIVNVDPAIRRSQRFDSALLVLPPGFGVKLSKLQAAGFAPSLTEGDINRALLEKGDGVGWLALIRFDQVDRFVERLKAAVGGAELTGPALNTVIADTLKPFASELLQLDWLGNSAKSSASSDMLHPLMEAQRRDYGVRPVARLDAELRSEDSSLPFSRDASGFVTVPDEGSEDPESWVLKQGDFTLLPNGFIVRNSHS
jgi:hypothetical protein